MTEEEKLTGIMIHEIYQHVEGHALEWDMLSSKGQAAYNAVAAKLNERFIQSLQERIHEFERGEAETLSDSLTVISELQSQITALKALVQDYKRFTSSDQPILKIGRGGWWQERDALNKRAQQLIGEEPKS